MLIPLSVLVAKYNIKPFGVVHVGAHQAEELEDYKKYGVKNVIWIEANPLLIDYLHKIVDKDHIVFCATIDKEDDKECIFNITNNGQSSSLLELEEHKKEHPTIHVVNKINVKTVRLDTLLNDNKIDYTKYDFLNLDIQGSELNALINLGDLIRNFKYIYTEVNKKELYKTCALFEDLNDFLIKKGFILREIVWTRHGWGDAFYEFTS